MDHLDFKTFLYERLKERGLTIRRLGEITGITAEHIENLSEERFGQLPAAPYLRGYLMKIGKVLDFDPAPWWDYFDRLNALKSSGPTDELPRNRFVQKPVAKYGWVVLVGIILVVYFGFRFQKIVGRPAIAVSYPPEGIVRVTEDAAIIKGNVEGTLNLSINNEVIPVDADGSWEKNIVLQPGMNTIEIRATKFLGGETNVMRQILYEPAHAPANVTTTIQTNAPAAP